MRALAAAAGALLLILQVFAAAETGARDHQGHRGAIVTTTASSPADCAGDATGGGAPHRHGADCAHFCILCCAGVEAMPPQAAAQIAEARPARLRGRVATASRVATDDGGQPPGFASSWSPQAPPFFS